MGGYSHKFNSLFYPSIQITDLSLFVCSHACLCCFSNLSHTVLTNFLQSHPDRLFYGLHDFFCCPVNFGKRGVCCCRQGSSSHLSVQIACKLFNSHSVANKIGHSVLASPSSWHGYRPPTKPDDNAQQPQQSQPKKFI